MEVRWGTSVGCMLGAPCHLHQGDEYLKTTADTDMRRHVGSTHTECTTPLMSQKTKRMALTARTLVVAKLCESPPMTVSCSQAPNDAPRFSSCWQCCRGIRRDHVHGGTHRAPTIPIRDQQSSLVHDHVKRQFCLLFPAGVNLFYLITSPSDFGSLIG
jgi:hypothetical protein